MASTATPTNPHRRRGLALAEGLTGASAIAGAAGLANGSIDLGVTINGRLPFASPLFAGVAVAVVVAAPMAVGAVLSWRGGRRANLVAVGAGVALMGWIVVEWAFIRSISWLHPTLFLVGAAIAVAGYRGWHLTGGAPPDEVGASRPGDAIRVPSRFQSTRAPSIDAPPSAVWPGPTRVRRGSSRLAGHVVRRGAGQPRTIPGVDEEGRRLGLGPRRSGHHPLRSLSGVALTEVGDFPMMRKMLIGVRHRAESPARASERELDAV